MPKRYIRRPDGTLIEDNGVTVDSSLAIAGAAADAKAVGDKLSEVSNPKGDLHEHHNRHPCRRNGRNTGVYIPVLLQGRRGRGQVYGGSQR